MTYEQIAGYVGHESGANGPITRIVMHATVSPCLPGGAEGNGRYFQSPNSGGLAHFVVDPQRIVQCAPEYIATWHAPPNHGSIGIELCDPQSGSFARWSDSEHRSMLVLAKGLVHDLAARHAVPLAFVDARGLVAGHHGVTTHYEVSQAWHQSDHSDPGPGFLPYMQFLLGGLHPAAHPLASKVYPLLALGSTGANVRRLQELLHIYADGVFGQNTKNAVFHFQVTHRLAADGVAGPATLATMRF